MNLILMILGFLIFIVLGMVKTKRKHPKIEFKPLVYLRDELLTLILSALCAITMTLLLPEIGDVIMPSYIAYIRTAYFLIGFLNYAMIDRLINIFNPKK